MTRQEPQKGSVLQVIKENTEELLVEAAYSLLKAKQKWSALHFHLSQLTADSLHKAHTVLAVNTICPLLPAHDGFIPASPETVFVCWDKDIIVLCCGRSQEQLNRVVHDLRIIYAEDPIACSEEALGEHSQFFTRYDLTQQYEEFYFACNRKRNLIRQMLMREGASLQQVEPEAMATAKRMREQRDGLVVLLVEDDNFIASLVSMTLRPQHEVLMVENAVEALRKYERAAPDIVFLDIELPDINGLEVLKEIMACDTDAFVVMLTSHGYFSNVKIAIDIGAKGFISKPFNKLTLDSYIVRCISERDMRRFKK